LAALTVTLAVPQRAMRPLSSQVLRSIATPIASPSGMTTMFADATGPVAIQLISHSGFVFVAERARKSPDIGEPTDPFLEVVVRVGQHFRIKPRPSHDEVNRARRWRGFAMDPDYAHVDVSVLTRERGRGFGNARTVASPPAATMTVAPESGASLDSPNFGRAGQRPRHVNPPTSEHAATLSAAIPP
jgi:hypothetical protein